MVNPLKYYNAANYHLEYVKKGYSKFMMSMNIPKTEKLSILDIGVGSGQVFNKVVLPLLPENAAEIVVSDLEKEMVDFCRKNNKDPRVTYEVLDIATDNIPTHLNKRFNLVFSSYCFSYLRNLRKGFSNSGKLLKQDGELLNLFQYKKNGLYQTYKRMSTMNKWKSYTKEYGNYETNLAGINPEVELTKIFKDIGMTLLGYEFDPDHLMDMPKRDILEAYKSLDKIYFQIPKHEQKEYMNDFIRILGEETDLDLLDESSYDQWIQINFPTVIVHAKN